MTSFSYDDTVPAAPHNPSVDQPTMLTNAAAIEGIIAVDHVGFNATNGGTHQQVTFGTIASPPYPNLNPLSYAYADTLAGNVTTYLEYQPNQGGGGQKVVPLSYKALLYGTTDAAGVSPTIAANSFNIATFTVSGLFVYSITFTENLNNSTPFVFISFKSSINIPPAIQVTAISNTGISWKTAGGATPNAIFWVGVM